MTSLGDGLICWLYLVWSTFLLSDRIVLIEEPELYLHPALLAHAAEYLRGRVSSSQIVMTTHSTGFIDQCEREEVWTARMIDSETKLERVKSIEGSQGNRAFAWSHTRFSLNGSKNPVRRRSL